MYGNNIKPNILTNYKISGNSIIKKKVIVRVRIQSSQLINTILFQLINELNYGINPWQQTRFYMRFLITCILKIIWQLF